MLHNVIQSLAELIAGVHTKLGDVCVHMSFLSQYLLLSACAPVCVCVHVCVCSSFQGSRFKVHVCVCVYTYSLLWCQYCLLNLLDLTCEGSMHGTFSLNWSEKVEFCVSCLILFDTLSKLRPCKKQGK